MNGMNSNTGPDYELVKTSLDEVVAQESMTNTREGKATATDEIIFTQDEATNAANIAAVLGGGGYFDKTLDDLAPAKNANIKASSPKVTYIADFKKNLPISKNFMADQQHSAVKKAVAQQMKTYYASIDRNAFSVYANGFTTQTTVDNVPVFSNSHINENGDTVDNLETGVLNDDNLNVAVVSLRGQVAQTGVLLGYEPDFLLTPSLLHKQGMAVAKSVLRAGTGNNDLNYYSDLYPGMQVKFNAFLDQTSTTAWFIGTKGHGITRFVREAFYTDLIDWKTDVNDKYTYKMRGREEVDSISYDGLVGSNGTV